VKFRAKIRDGASERDLRDDRRGFLGDPRPGEECTCDELFVVAGGLIFPELRRWGKGEEKVTASDGWKKAYRKELATMFPGIKP
jgi:hypothetical protein